MSCSADNGGDSAEVANAVSAQATITQESTSRMARNKIPDSAEEKRRRKFKGENFLVWFRLSLSRFLDPLQ